VGGSCRAQRKIISEGTKAALQAAKARGTRLGNPRLGEARRVVNAGSQADADTFTSAVAPAVRKRGQRQIFVRDRRRLECSRDSNRAARPLGSADGRGLQLLREVVPTATRIAALQHPGMYSERTMQNMLTEMEKTAKESGVELQAFSAIGPEDFDAASPCRWMAAATRARRYGPPDAPRRIRHQR
jgi:hypothetical protein